MSKQMLNQSPSRHLAQGVGLLTLTGLIAKVLSAMYRIPLQNMVGNAGFYVYQQVYPLYGIGVVLALSGWPMLIAKVVSEQSSQRQAQIAAARLHRILVVISLILFSSIYFGAPTLACWMGGDLQLIPVIQMVAWMFLFMPILATTRGYSQGLLNMKPTAISQIVEQLVRVLIIVGVAWWANTQKWTIYQTGQGTMAGAPLAALVASLVLWPTFRQFGMIQVRTDERDAWPQLRWTVLVKRLWYEGGLLVLVTALLVLFQLMDSFSVKGLLVHSGFLATQAESWKGIYDRGQPLVQLGMVLATSLGTVLLPNLRQFFVQQKKQAFQLDFQRSFRLSLFLILLTTVGMIAVMPYLNQTLFGSRQGTVILDVYVLSMIPATLMTVGVTVLQSLDQTRYLCWKLMLGIGCKWLLNQALMPSMGLVGASCSTVLSLSLVWFLVWWQLPQMLRQSTPFAPRWLLKSICFTGLMGIIVALALFLLGKQLPNTRLMSSVLLFLGVILGGAISAFLTIYGKLLTVDEWQLLPYGERLIQRFKIR
ncbi:oligosaccharide flippase family protein [Weissella kandleri]|uniref:putative polysaccharide biosynthesis protein n=1 Tax=Weissella kandleri TaxID=1616 RepID=UPI00387E2FCA